MIPHRALIPPDECPDVREVSVNPRIFETITEFRWGAIRVPAGFLCDGASVPRIVRNLIDDDDLSEAAWLLHDYLYSVQGVVSEFIRFTRADVDRLLNSINIRHGVVPWKRRAVYAAVRLCGWHAWNSHKEKA